MIYTIQVRQVTGKAIGAIYTLRVRSLVDLPKCYELIAILSEEAPFAWTASFLK